MYGAEFVTVPTDDDGMVTDRLEDALRCGPKFIYALPNFQNPSGVTMPLERREALIRASDHYGIPIIEDDPYGQLRYEGEHIKPLVVIDAECLECEHNGKYTGQRDLPEHVQQDARAGAADGVDGGAEGSHQPARAGQAGHRPAVQHLRPDGRRSRSAAAVSSTATCTASARCTAIAGT